MFYVYSLTGKLPDYKGCIIVEEGSLVNGIYSKAFGPDTIDACKDWKKRNCVLSDIDHKNENSPVFISHYSDENLFMDKEGFTTTATSIPRRDAGNFFIRSEAFNFNPHLSGRRTETLYINGEPGAKISIFAYFRQGSGGHDHDGGSSDPNAVGTYSPRSFILPGPYPQDFEVQFTFPEIRGEMTVDLFTTHTDGTTQSYPHLATISGPTLQSLPTSKGIMLAGVTDTHHSNHWGTPELCAALKVLGEKFAAEYAGSGSGIVKVIYVNDMSLMWGGLFDHKATFTPPHDTHRDGNIVDVNWSSMNDDQRKFFKSEAEKLGFKVEIHSNPTHWHLIL